MVLATALVRRQRRANAVVGAVMLSVGVTSFLGAVGVLLDLTGLAFMSVVGGVLARVSCVAVAVAFRATEAPARTS